MAKWQYKIAAGEVDSSGNPVDPTIPSSSVPSSISTIPVGYTEDPDPDIAAAFIINAEDKYEKRPELSNVDPKVGRGLAKIGSQKKRGLSNRTYSQLVKENTWASAFKSIDSFMKEMLRAEDYSAPNVKRI